jgi:hypothetical protein
MAHGLLTEVLESYRGAARPAHGAVIELQHFILHNFRRRKVRGRDNAGIIPDPASHVRGLRIQGLTDRDVQAFDLYAGPLYQRQKVVVKCMENRSLEENIPNSALASIPGAVEEVETYVCLYPATLENEDWDFRSWPKARSTSNASFSLSSSAAIRAMNRGSRAGTTQAASGRRGSATSRARPAGGDGAGSSAGRLQASSAGSGTGGGRGPATSGDPPAGTGGSGTSAGR